MDAIDVKEPSRGLGAADAAVWDDVVRIVAGRAPVSVALGELLSAGIEERAEAAIAPICLAKIGLAGCHPERGWLCALAASFERCSVELRQCPWPMPIGLW